MEPPVDPRVDAHIDALPAGQQSRCHDGFREGETINAPALTAMFRQTIANNRAGGWRGLKRDAQNASWLAPVWQVDESPGLGLPSAGYGERRSSFFGDLESCVEPSGPGLGDFPTSGTGSGTS